MKKTKEHGYSEFWLDKATAYKKSEDPSMESLLNFAAIQGAISNFVKIVTGKNIPVRFNTKSNQSATDGRKVVVSADVSETNFDSTVGLSLHEASHILLSDFELLNKLPEHIPAPVYQAADTLGIKSTGLVSTIVHRIMNVIEDRRIDYFMYSTAPGYRGYYQSMYNKYWHSEIVNEALKSGSYRNEDWDSYDYRIVNLSNPNTDLDALRGLREIGALIDLKNIKRFKTSEEVLAVACDVAIIIFKNITLPKPKKQPPVPGLGKKSKGSGKKEKDEKGELDENNMPDSNFSPEQSEEPQESEEDKEGKSGKGKEDEGDEPFSKKEIEEAEGENGKEDEESEEEKASSKSDFEDDSEQKTDDEQKDAESKAGEKNEDEEKAEDEMKAGATSSEGEDEEEKEPEPDPLSKKDEEEAKKAHEKQVDFLNHDIDKEEMSDEMAKNLEKVSQSDASIEDVDYDYFGTDIRVPVVVIRNVSEDFYASDMCLFSAKSFNKEENGVFITGVYEEQVKEGITLGRLLGRHLQIRNDVKKRRVVRKSSGKIVRRLLHEAGMGNENVFGRVTTEQFDKAEIHTTIDISGSMSGTKLGQAIVTVVAIAQFASMTKNIGVVISVRYTDYSDGAEDTPYIAVMYDSHKDKFSKVRRMFPHLVACGCTPEGLTFAAIEKEIVSSSKGVKSYFINFSDGAPMCSIHKNTQVISYANEPAAAHTRAQVKKLRNRGIKIMSFFIETSVSYGVDCNAQFKTMYGKDAKTVKPGNLPELARALEEMFLDKDSEN